MQKIDRLGSLASGRLGLEGQGLGLEEGGSG